MVLGRKRTRDVHVFEQPAGHLDLLFVFAVSFSVLHCKRLADHAPSCPSDSVPAFYLLIRYFLIDSFIYSLFSP